MRGGQVIWSGVISRRRRRRASTHRGHHPHLVLKGALALAASAGLVFAGLLSAEPSIAATPGAGLMASAFGGFLGNEITPTGARGYCADPSRAAPFGSTDGGAPINSFTSDSGHTLDGDEMQKVNYVLQRFGDTSDDTQAAAVSAYVYAFTGSNLGGGIVVATREEGAAYIDSGFGPVSDRYNQIWDDAEANWNGGASVPAGGSLDFQIAEDNFTGTVTASVSPSSATGSITLENGTFVATGSATMNGVVAGQTFDIAATPPSDDDVAFQVAGVGTFVTPSVMRIDSNLTLFSTGAEQRLLAAGSTSSTSTSFTVSGKDEVGRSAMFAPVVGTAVESKFVSQGQKPQDALTFQSTSFVNAAGRTVSNPWSQKSSGEYRTVCAEGTLYGPSLSPFAPSITPPVGTPVAGHATVTTDGDHGPNRTYLATSDTAVAAAGYYTWVWSITSTGQTGDSSRFMPSNYSFADGFGQVSETHMTPTGLTFETQVSPAQVALGGSFTDAITPNRDSAAAWIQVGGGNVPVTLTGTVYYSADRPSRSAEAPASAQVVRHLSKVLSSTETVESPAISAGSVSGFLTIQWSIRRAAQPVELQGLVSDWSDDYGIPEETVEVQPPAIITTAQPISGPGGTVHDSATVSGLMPTAGLDISFAGYLQTAGSTTPVCDASTKRFASSRPTFASGPGVFESEEFSVPADVSGEVLWIETATIHGTDTAVHRGVCGQRGESTHVGPPTISTVPPEGAVSGSSVHDTATVSGWINDGTVVVFYLYKQAEGASALVCDSKNQVGGALGPIPITPGVADAATYQSPESSKLEPGQYGFVEQLVDRTGKVTISGGCHDELFTVSSPPAGLALTGIQFNDKIGIGVGLLGGGAIALCIFLLARRKVRADKM